MADFVQADFVQRVEEWIGKDPLDAVILSEAILLSRAAGSLLALGVSEEELRTWFNIVIRDCQSQGDLLGGLEQAFGLDLGGKGKPT